MPKLRIGTIPPVRLHDARRERNHLAAVFGNKAKVTLTIKGGGFAVQVRLTRECGSFSPPPSAVPIIVKRSV